MGRRVARFTNRKRRRSTTAHGDGADAGEGDYGDGEDYMYDGPERVHPPPDEARWRTMNTYGLFASTPPLFLPHEFGLALTLFLPSFKQTVDDKDGTKHRFKRGSMCVLLLLTTYTCEGVGCYLSLPSSPFPNIDYLYGNITQQSNDPPTRKISRRSNRAT